MSIESDQSALPSRLADFVRYRKEHLTGDEKGEAAIFLENLFRALGHEGVRQAGATLEKRVKRRDNGGTAYADLEWKPRVLVEMKKAGRDLRKDYRQVFEYWIDLVPDRPQYVILCNFDEFWIYDLNLQLEEPVDRVDLDDLPTRWDALAFLLPIEEKPIFGNDLVAVTRETAAQVSSIFNRIIARDEDRDAAQRFILQAVMAMFSEDIGLLPGRLFNRALEDVLEGHGTSYDLLFSLFREMDIGGETSGGRYQGTPYFNGGLYRDIEPFELERSEVEDLHAACQEDWSAVRPVIFGTLFEQSLEKPERHAYGAYFTSETDIQRVVLPSIVRPWRERIDGAETLEELGQIERDMLNYQVLDPACGSGNFLYVAYRELRRLEKQVRDKRLARSRESGRREAMQLAFVSTKQFHGIDLRPFAVEVAKVTLMLARKLAADELEDERTYLPLDQLDANFQTANAITAPWPRFDVCIGNPPYLGAKNFLAEKSPEEIVSLRREYPDIGGTSDYVTYWFRKVHDHLPEGGRAGLVGTANIRSGDTRKNTLDYIVDHDGVIFEAVSGIPWSGDASVEVSIVNWIKGRYEGERILWLSRGSSKMAVDQITGSLSPETDLRDAAPLKSNKKPKAIFQGQTPQHNAFVLTPEAARVLVEKDPASGTVIFPYLIGKDLIRDKPVPTRFIIDFAEEDQIAAQSQAPGAFDRVRKAVLPARELKVSEEAERNAELMKADQNARLNWERREFMSKWWHLWRRRQDMLEAIERLERYIVVSRVAVLDRPSIYAFVSPEIRPGDALTVFAFEDDYSFGILNSSHHRAYFEERCSKMRTDPRYTSKTVFDTFPWPQAPTEGAVEAVVDASAQLTQVRDENLEAGISLEAQYNAMRSPGHSALREAQTSLDAAVAKCYGFSADEEVLAQLLALNQSIAEQEETGLTEPRRPGNAGLTDTVRTSSRIEVPFQLQ